MRAQDVRAMKPGAPLRDSARLVIGARLDELEQLRTRITDEEQSDALHDLRIAAKRLRYSLEMFAVCFDPKSAQKAADRVRELQDLLGRIHDLDVVTELLEARLRALDGQVRAGTIAAVRSASVGAERDAVLRAALRRDTTRGARAGIYRVIAAKADERARRYDEFLQLWHTWEDEHFVESVRGLIADSEPADLP
jgi:CHAD domain-containing protein